MASCSLTIELDRPKAAYHPGDELSGTVLVTTDSEVRCKELSIELKWETHGRGNRTSGEPVRQVLFEGQWQEGSSTRYGFRMVLPNGPATYHGHYLNVGWFLRARAKVPWKIDPKTEYEIHFTSGNGEQEIQWRDQYPRASGIPDRLSEGGDHLPNLENVAGANHPAIGGSLKKEHNATSNLFGCGCLALFLLPFLIIGAVFARDGWASFEALLAGNFSDGFGAIIFLALVAMALVAGLYAFVRWRLVAGRFGDVEVHLDPLIASPGDTVSLRLGFTPSKDTQVDRIVATLHAYEKVISGSGTNKSTHRHDLHDEEFDLASNTQLIANRPANFAVNLQLPESAAPSFHASENQLTWCIKLRIEVPRFPDWKDTEQIVVRASR